MYTNDAKLDLSSIIREPVQRIWIDNSITMKVAT